MNIREGYSSHLHCWNRRHSLGDKDTPNEPIPDTELDKIGVWLPVYMYDHSGITIRTFPYSCRWDSGRLGYIYLTWEDIRKNYGRKRITKRLKSEVIEDLIFQIQELDDYLQGDEDEYVEE